MKYLIILSMLLALSGAAFAQGNEAAEEERTYAPVDPAEMPEPTGRNMHDIREKISEVKTVIQNDYEVLLETSPEAMGILTVNFSITPEGSVSDVLVECPVELTDLRENVVTAIEELDFGPAPDQTANLPIEIPFSLSPPQ